MPRLDCRRTPEIECPSLVMVELAVGDRVKVLPGPPAGVVIVAASAAGSPCHTSVISTAVASLPGGCWKGSAVAAPAETVAAVCL